MSDTVTRPDTPAEADEDKRRKARVDALLARPPAVAVGEFRPQAGDPMPYESRAVFLPVHAAGMDAACSDAQAAVLCTSYVLRGAAAADRGLCFAFNGGPGSASIWLHLGVLGPKRVAVPDDGSMPVPPYEVVDNPQAWFEHFDLVFIDPPQTGWSVASSAAARKTLLSVDGDVQAMVDVIRQWLTRHGRWGSRLFLAGESYGTTRAAAMADKLADAGVALAGVVLVSCAMDLQALEFVPGNDLPYALFLPALANVAQFHGLLTGPHAADAQAARQAARAFVEDDYLTALHLGHRLDGRRRARVARRLSELTGLPRALVEACNLRISDQTFFFEALRERGQMVGRLDARVTGAMAARRTRDWEFDPGIEAIAAPYTMAAMNYFRDVLGLDLDARYEVLSGDAHKAWNWNRGEGQGNGFACTRPDLARAMRRNPHLGLFVASGHYDLGTPYSASDWSLAQLDVPAALQARVVHRYYDAGHMMYTRSADLRQLKRDLGSWLSSLPS